LRYEEVPFGGLCTIYEYAGDNLLTYVSGAGREARQFRKQLELEACSAIRLVSPLKKYCLDQRFDGGAVTALG
jgi:hypothetical protein